MTAFYNEIDPYTARWLRNLIAAGHIAPGVVDERPIQEIEAWELAGYTQCHFFAGIGVWSHALRRAGWPDDMPIWTGSCPCQPFSAAGKRKGKDDERHLWPFWFKLIEQCKPPTVVGEQVASKDGLGWFDLVSADMEGARYSIGASDLCAAGFGQAHIRQRLYFVAVGHSGFQSSERDARGVHEEETRGPGSGNFDGRHNYRYSDASQVSGMADSEGERLPGRADDFNGGRRKFASGQGSEISGLADPMLAGRPARWTGAGNGQIARGDGSSPRPLRNSGEIDQRWLDADWLLCRNPAGEPSWRPVEPGTFPLAHGVTQRVGKLRAYGNGLDAETATAFCEVVKEIVDEIGV